MVRLPYFTERTTTHGTATRRKPISVNRMLRKTGGHSLDPLAIHRKATTTTRIPDVGKPTGFVRYDRPASPPARIGRQPFAHRSETISATAKNSIPSNRRSGLITITDQ